MKYLDKVLEINEIDGQHQEAASKEYLAAKERVKAWEYAGKIVNPLFEAHGIPVDKSELFLVGTHMEMAIASAEAVQ